MNDHVTEPSEVNPAPVAALNDAALVRHSSKAIFQRGQTYARSGAVDVTREEPGETPALYAIVQGTEPYATEVWIHEGELGGTCDCVNAQEGWFCKHQVALALIWRERLSGEAPSAAEQVDKKVTASAKRGQTIQDRRQALMEFLHAQPATILADRLLDMADRDTDTHRELQQWRKLSEAPQGAAELKALVTEIMSPSSSFISWDESGGYVHRAQAVLDVLVQARSRDPSLAATLSLHAMRRGWAVLMQADDSGGDIGDLIRSIGDEWVASLKEARPQPAAFGDTYLKLLLDDPFGCFDTAAAEAALGSAALNRFRSALAVLWRQTKDRASAARAEHETRVAQALANKRRAPYFERDSELSSRLWSLERLHLRQLEAEGDLEGVLSVMREDMSEPAAFQRVTAVLERHGRLREAFANTEQGCKAFPDDTRLQDDLLRCYDRDGWIAEAFELRRRRFSRSPSVERYHEVLKAGCAAARDVGALRAELQAELIASEERALAGSGKQASFYSRSRGAQAAQRDVTLRVDILCSEGRVEDGLALVHAPAYCGDGVLVRLARRLGPEQSAQRIELLQRVFDHEMQDSKTPYRQELARVAEIASLLDPMRRAFWLGQLRSKYKAKRNFVRDLPAT